MIYIYIYDFTIFGAITIHNVKEHQLARGEL